jgi:hypothetical protein
MVLQITKAMDMNAFTLQVPHTGSFDFKTKDILGLIVLQTFVVDFYDALRHLALIVTFPMFHHTIERLTVAGN